MKIINTLHLHLTEIPIEKALRHQIEVQKRLDEQLEVLFTASLASMLVLTTS
ncbi:unnamed protein product [Lupinus luteus]|uniref:MYB-CC type transcription factor LHEQLE-containing domain-containing protein n=1 Tax=Lupinus luteus TaxID=3873 RepID=A0AAV1WNT4_LUPLU